MQNNENKHAHRKKETNAQGRWGQRDECSEFSGAIRNINNRHTDRQNVEKESERKMKYRKKHTKLVKHNKCTLCVFVCVICVWVRACFICQFYIKIQNQCVYTK